MHAPPVRPRHTLLPPVLLALVWCGCDSRGDAVARDPAGGGENPAEVVFVSDRGGTGLDLYRHVLGTDEFTRIAADTGDAYGPAWSPDGARIVYENDGSGDWEVYAIDPDGSNRANLSRFSGHDGGASWAPDGRRVIFTSTREARAAGHAGRDLWEMDPDGSGLRRLTSNGEYDDAARISPDGRRIAFCRQVTEPDGSADGEVFVMDRDGANETRRTRRPGFDCLPDWSPDGARIAFHGCGAEACHIFVMDADGSNLRQLTGAHGGNWPRWSPDGEWIAYTATIAGQTDIWIVRPDGSDARALTSDPGRDEVASWRPGGARPPH